MHFRSVAELSRDVARWSDTLPNDIDLVVGIPRSGILAASLLALHLNLPMTDLEGLREGRIFGGGRRLPGNDADALFREARTILVLDDSINFGSSMAEAREQLRDHELFPKLKFAAVYHSPVTPMELVDATYANVPHPRVFEWNLLHHALLPQFCLDIDGVLCRDPSDLENDDGPNYGEFLATVPGRMKPTGKVGWLVTSRLERYRPETEAWLAAAGVSYGELIMYPGSSAEERRLKGDHASFKADAYRRTGALLFVESSIRQARHIADAVKKPVFCTDERIMLYPGQPAELGRTPRQRDIVRWAGARARRRLVQRIASRLPAAR